MFVLGSLKKIARCVYQQKIFPIALLISILVREDIGTGLVFALGHAGLQIF